MAHSASTEQVRDELRAVCWPGFDQDIAAAGFVKQVEVRDGSVPIDFEVRTRKSDKVDAMEEGIRNVLSSLPGVEVRRKVPGDRSFAARRSNEFRDSFFARRPDPSASLWEMTRAGLLSTRSSAPSHDPAAARW